MRKIAFLLAASLCMFVQANAQSKNKIQFGIKGGMNHTVINGVETNGTKTGFIGTTLYGAIFAETHIGETTFLNNELLFCWVNDWHFIEVPILVKQMLSKKISVMMGPKLDFAADRLDKFKESKSDVLGVSVETGAQYNLLKKVFGEIRYSFGVTKQFRDEGFDINDGRRNNFRVGFGYRF